MPARRCLLVLALSAGCASSPGPDASAPPATGPTGSPSPSPGPSPSPAPIEPPGARVCMPVAACNGWASCALAEEVRGDGGVAYRVLSYEHHPNRAGELWARAQTCWDARGEHRCADALQYTSVPCTPVPPQQMELDYACRMDGERCILVER